MLYVPGDPQTHLGTFHGNAIANVANLLLARGTARSRHIRQLMIESIVLSVAGTLLGTGLGHFSLSELYSGSRQCVERFFRGCAPLFVAGGVASRATDWSREGGLPMKLSLVARTSALCLLAIVLTTPAHLAQAPESINAKTWTQDPAAIEEYIKSAKVVSMKELSVGVTKPKRAELAPGGPVAAIAWKKIPPGRYEGYWESYKSEIAAYELDKLLGLGMVPPTVEKRVEGDLGAAVMWVSPTKSFKELGGVPGQKGVKGPPPAQIGMWTNQITRAKMFDDLIGNTDPNLGNWLVDPAWNLILIDHTRAFTSNNLYHQLVQVDTELWDKMKALDEASLTAAVGRWLDKREIKGILERRNKMQQVVDKLLKK